MKLCDFGLARFLEGSQSNSESDKDANHMTEYVVTRWYRAPEIVISPGLYGKAQDIWSAACTFSEQFRRKPIFPGSSVLNQLQTIVDVMGKPSDEDLDFGISSRARRFMNALTSENTGLKNSLAGATEFHSELAPLLASMLAFNPNMRISSSVALESCVFEEIRRQRMGHTTGIVNNGRLSDLSNSIRQSLKTIDTCPNNTTAFRNLMEIEVSEIKMHIRLDGPDQADDAVGETQPHPPAKVIGRAASDSRSHRLAAVVPLSGLDSGYATTDIDAAARLPHLDRNSTRRSGSSGSTNSRGQSRNSVGGHVRSNSNKENKTDAAEIASDTTSASSGSGSGYLSRSDGGRSSVGSAGGVSAAVAALEAKGRTGGNRNDIHLPAVGGELSAASSKESVASGRWAEPKNVLSGHAGQGSATDKEQVLQEARTTQDTAGAAAKMRSSWGTLLSGSVQGTAGTLASAQVSNSGSRTKNKSVSSNVVSSLPQTSSVVNPKVRRTGMFDSISLGRGTSSVITRKMAVVSLGTDSSQSNQNKGAVVAGHVLPGQFLLEPLRARSSGSPGFTIGHSGPSPSVGAPVHPPPATISSAALRNADNPFKSKKYAASI